MPYISDRDAFLSSAQMDESVLNKYWKLLVGIKIAEIGWLSSFNIIFVAENEWVIIFVGNVHISSYGYINYCNNVQSNRHTIISGLIMIKWTIQFLKSDVL
jgi:hypothetical protein